MTLLHFINCGALLFGPCVVLYKSAKLDDVDAWKGLLITILAYAVNQMSQMLLLATLPSGVFLSPLFTAVASLLEIPAFSSALSRIKQEVISKIMTAGLGWAVADAVRLIPSLWMDENDSALPIAAAGTGTIISSIAVAALVVLLIKSRPPLPMKSRIRLVVEIVLLQGCVRGAKSAGIWPSGWGHAIASIVVGVIALVTSFVETKLSRKEHVS